MNRNYKVVWNRSLGCFTAVAEYAKSRGKSSSGAVSSSSAASSAVASGTSVLRWSALCTGLIVAGFSMQASAACTAGATSFNCGAGSSANNSGVAIGQNAAANAANNTIAIGRNATASADQAIAVGGVDAGPNSKATTASGDQSIAIGANVISSGSSALAIGGDDLDRASRTNVAADGTVTELTGLNTGNVNDIFKDISGRNLVDPTTNATRYVSTESFGAGSVAIGTQATSKGALSTAFGTQTKADGIASAAFGVSADASKDGSVALGAGSSTLTSANSVTNATINGITYSNFAGSTGIIAGDQVSVGSAGRERQIKSVAAGNINSGSTDAINGSQLFSVARTLSNDQPVVYTDAAGNRVFKQADGTFNNAAGASVPTANVITSIQAPNGTTNTPTKLTNVAAGTAATDAVNKGQLDAQKIKYVSVKSTETGAGSNVNNDGATGDDSIAIGPNTAATGEFSISIGKEAGKGSVGVRNLSVGYQAGQNSNGDSNVVLGPNAGNNVNGAGNTASGSFAGNRVTGNSNTTLGVNSGQDVIGNNNVGLGVSAGRSVTGKNNIAAGFGAGNTVFGEDNIALGADSGITIGTATAPVFNTIAIGRDAKATSNTGIAVGTAATSSYANAVALGANSATGASLAVLTAQAGYNGGKGTLAGNNPAGEVAVGAAGTERRITNLAAGAAGTDAVNVSQLKSVADSSVQYDQAGKTSVTLGGTGATTPVALNNVASAGNLATAANANKAVNAGDVNTAITGVTNAGLQFSGDNGTAFTRKLGQELKVRGGNTATANLTDNNIGVVSNDTDTLTIKLNKNLDLGTDGSVKTGNTVTNNAGVTITNGTNITTMTGTGTTVTDGTNTTNYGANGFAIAGGPSATKAGINAGNKQITNVLSGGTTATNAANIGDVTTAATSARTIVAGGTNAAVTKITAANGQDTYTVNADGTTVSAGSPAVSVTPGAKNANNVTDFAVDLSAATKTSLTKADNSVQYDQAGKTSVTLGNAGTPVTLANVAAGTATTDAVNFGQLTTTNNNVTTAQNAANAAQTSANTAQTTADQGFNISAASGAIDNVQLGETVDFTSGNTNLTVTNDGNNGIKYTLADNLTLNSVTTGNTKISNTGITITNPADAANNVVLGSTGLNNGNNKITNVANGNIAAGSKDAVNGGQINTLVNNATTAINNNTTAINNNTTEINKGLNFTGDTGTKVNRALGTTLKVQGGETDTTKLSNNNIGVVANGTDGLLVQLAKNINLGTDGSVTTGDTRLSNTGLRTVK